MEHGPGSCIRIFSRSDENEYRWLADVLREDWPVSPFIITNRNFSSFSDAVYRCSFGILYHSRNRGRVNITNVTDSLYDEEVRTMSAALGKERVITIIDDLDDSGHEAKERILRHQQSLKTLTQDIFLFTQQEKANYDHLRRRIKDIKQIIARSVRRSPVQGPDEAGPRTEGGVRRLFISAVSFFVFWNTYYFPTRENGALVALWAAVTYWVFRIRASNALLPLNHQGRFALSCAVTLMKIYDTYHRPSASNFADSALWIIYGSVYFWNRRQMRSYFWTAISYGLPLVTLWMAWRPLHAETTFQMISQFVFRSPAIAVATGI
ncbi:uncharacterized protein LOC142656103 isoform X2 [Rhinoderma darwinii]|uniref:uncharacterized protein LOC142656103 isoform X2 n=1 Tax=Rhinoderma darwinii TaxID=43563 RepID=UPI003F6610C6